MDLSYLYENVRRCISERAEFIRDDEGSIIEDELRMFERLTSSGLHSLEDVQRILARTNTPIFCDLSESIQRLHEVAGLGSLTSCQSSSMILEAFSNLGLIRAYGVASNLCISRGHIAPAIYSIRYLKGGFPLSFLFSVYDVIPPVINQYWGFPNSSRHSLGEGLPLSVGKALGSGMSEEEQHFFCFAGDGEMQEGITYEAIRLAYEFNIKRFTLVVDENGMGIAKLVKPLNLKYLEAYFDGVYVVDDCREEIEKRLKVCKQKGLREAIVVKTLKTYHSYRRNKGSRATTCSNVGNVLNTLKSEGCQMFVFCPDMVGRFGLKDKVNHFNTGLAEQSTVALTMALPLESLKFILTDDKFLLNSLDCLHSTFAYNQNIIVIAARKNAVWGGPLNTPNIFANLEGAECYELCNPAHIPRIISRGSANAFILLNDEELERVQSIEDEYEELGYDCLNLENSDDLLFISTESFATTVNELSHHFGASHLRFLSRRPLMSKEVVQRLEKFRRIVMFEQNPAHGGVGEFLRSSTLKDIQILSVEKYDSPAVRGRQKILSGIDLKTLIESTEELLKCSKLRINSL